MICVKKASLVMPHTLTEQAVWLKLFQPL